MMSRKLPHAIAASVFAVVLLSSAASPSAAATASAIASKAAATKAAAAKQAAQDRAFAKQFATFKLAHPCDASMHGM
jgi:hypothetical protein